MFSKLKVVSVWVNGVSAMTRPYKYREKSLRELHTDHNILDYKIKVMFVLEG